MNWPPSWPAAKPVRFARFERAPCTVSTLYPALHPFSVRASLFVARLKEAFLLGTPDQPAAFLA
jgi:hypothetical protein